LIQSLKSAQHLVACFFDDASLFNPKFAYRNPKQMQNSNPRNVKKTIQAKAIWICFCHLNFDAFVKSPKTLFSVIPAEAGIQSLQGVLDSRLRGSDGLEDFLRGHQEWSDGVIRKWSIGALE
jgi:hypothetical protein